MQNTEQTTTRFSGTSLLKNTSLNFIGQALPIIIALVSIPRLIHILGNERFGVLMLAWMFLGYFNLFDFGLSRALTKNIAEKIDSDSDSEFSYVFWTVSVSTFVFGIAGAVAMGLASGWLVDSVLKIPTALKSEAGHAFLVIALSLPFVISTSCFKGVLEATQKFRVINQIQVPMGILFYLSPILFALFSTSLPVVISALVLSRLIGWVCYFVAAMRVLPGIARWKFDLKILPPLLKFGGWVTVANIPIPIISYADRFVVGMILSMTAVTYYSTPYEIVNKFWVVPAAIMSVVFPAFASQLKVDRDNAAVTFIRANKLLLLTLTPITIVAILFSYEGLLIWSGEDLAINSYRVLTILALAIFLNCFGIVPSALLDALNQPAITAISHLVQLPLYIGALLLVIPRYGIEGAAFVWVARNAIDSGTLFWFASRKFRQSTIRLVNFLIVIVPLSALVAWVLVVQPTLRARTAVCAACLISFLFLLWTVVMSRTDRSWVLRKVFALFNPARSDAINYSKRDIVGIALAAYRPDNDVFAVQLKSIQSQTYSNWLCVISSDSDIDMDDSKLRPFVTDTRFHWVRNTGRNGVKGNFENAMKEALGRGADMIAFSDQDDAWYPRKLDTLVAELRKCLPLSLVHSDMHLFSNDDEIQPAHRESLPKGWENESRVLEAYSPLHFLLRNTVTGAASLFDAELAQMSLPIPDEIEFHDHWLAIMASIFGEIRAVHEALYAYRQHSNNVVGFVRFEGIFYKPADMTWSYGWRKASSGWARRRALYNYVVNVKGVKERLPLKYKFIFREQAERSDVFPLRLGFILSR